eukprot:TRINITY_DN10298_c0_g3_i1.p1 TRINITY_DN10298_c0_g3~~TRINITY_DN10298_c0_g3_i1.p1  ORF type:complete len:324 (+),score=125.07 TRINITY_DN10298_c0_g3_i1:106-972(+)
MLGPALTLAAVAAAAVPSIEIAPGVQLPMVSLGTGSGQKGNVSEAVRLWLGAGGTSIDTAYIYRDEKDIAQGLAEAGVPRSAVFLESKIPCLSYKAAKSAFQSNLQQLGVTQVDLTLVHYPWCELGGSLSGTWQALEEAQAAGQTRSIGVSNFKQADFEKLFKSAKVRPVINQGSFSVVHHDDATVDYCRAQGILYQSYSPLCGGGNGSSCPYGSVMKVAEVQAVAAAHNVSAAQIGLKWVVQQGVPLATAAWKQDYMREDLDLWSWGNLTAAEMEKLSAVAQTAARA